MKKREGKTVITVALAGNPNSGKSSLFNKLIGGNQHIGNYPGVTVEKYQGCIRHNGEKLEVTDLPGIYSMTSYSQEEVIARRFLVEEAPDVVVNVVDAGNLERNLYLTVQLLEMGLNIIVVLNMMDEVRRKGIVLDIDMLSQRLGCPVVETVASQGQGIPELKDMILAAAAQTDLPAVEYIGILGDEVARLAPLISGKTVYNPAFAAVKLLEDDQEVADDLRNQADAEMIFDEVAVSMQRIERHTGNSSAIVLGDKRYGFAAGLVREITLKSPEKIRFTVTEIVDSIVTNRFFGLPVFALSMYLTFWITFTLGTPPMNWIEQGFEQLALLIETILPDFWLRSLLVDGVIAGVGGVVVFLPNIVLLFMCIAFLEDTGYMARIAFIMDRVMHRMGLHGRSFIPLMIGFGCTIPALMATRTIRDRRGRFTTMMILPLMSCGARLPIYLMVIPAFFPRHWHTPVLWSIYLTGVLLAFGAAILLRKTLFRGENEPFVMELPPYRLPSFAMVMRHMWERSWMYLKKAGTIILGFSILLWALLNFPQKNTTTTTGLLTPGTRINASHPAAFEQAGLPDIAAVLQPGTRVTADQIDRFIQIENLRYSITGRIGAFIEPVMKPMGFDWKIGTAFLSAFPAKELFVSQMSIILAQGDISSDELDPDSHGSSLRDALRRHYPNPLTGLCIILFALIATPCVATIVLTAKEAGKWYWGLFQWTGLTALGWVLTTLLYQTGRYFIR
jgi:ferrous iron transport protein B